ncbi:MAG: D-alanyl-D-alanine carboxypeptidase [Clostridia bacterium]|nr:D-alanyl-D-alanine carboxypeptidase [Clostridia bacterium]
MIKKYFSLFLCILVSIPVFSIRPKAVSLGISASAAVVMVAQTGEVIYEYNAHKQLSMASTTKIMTSLLALEKADLNKEITVREEELKVEGTSMGLLAGDKVTYEGLVYGMLLQSGNDAANVVASRLGKNIDNFIVMMNKRAVELGMKNTHFATPSGLDDDEHYSTAYDMALLGSEAIKNPDFRYISSQTSARVYYGNPPYSRTLTNHNKMLKMYDGCIGLKTGFTKKSGRCLVTAAERDGILLVAVTLNAPDDWNDHKILLDYGFSEVENKHLEPQSVKLPVVGGVSDKVTAVPAMDAYVNLISDYSEYKPVYLVDKFMYAPVEKGEIAGKILYLSDGRCVAEVLLIANETIALKKVNKKEKSFRIRFRNYMKSIFEKLRRKIWQITA